MSDCPRSFNKLTCSPLKCAWFPLSDTSMRPWVFFPFPVSENSHHSRFPNFQLSLSFLFAYSSDSQQRSRLTTLGKLFTQMKWNLQNGRWFYWTLHRSRRSPNVDHEPGSLSSISFFAATQGPCIHISNFPLTFLPGLSGSAFTAFLRRHLRRMSSFLVSKRRKTTNPLCCMPAVSAIHLRLCFISRAYASFSLLTKNRTQICGLLWVIVMENC